MTDVNANLDKALEAVDEYLGAGANGRQEKAIARALDNVIEAIRELAPKAKAKAATAADDTEAKPPAKKPAKKSTAKKG